MPRFSSASSLLLSLSLTLAASSPAWAAQPDAPAAEQAKGDAARSDPIKGDPAMAGWVRQVHAIVIRAAGSLGRRLALGTYRVSFTVDEHGRGSNYGVEGARPDPKQSSMIMGALISRSFPAPPDGASHAVSFTLRNGAPARPPAAAGPPADGRPGDGKPGQDGAKP